MIRTRVVVLYSFCHCSSDAVEAMCSARSAAWTTSDGSNACAGSICSRCERAPFCEGWDLGARSDAAIGRAAKGWRLVGTNSSRRIVSYTCSR